MSALTQDILRPVKKKLSPEQREQLRQQAERILGSAVPPKADVEPRSAAAPRL